MNLWQLRRRIARWLGYGGVEWPCSGIENMPVMLVRMEDYAHRYAPSVRFVSVCCYPGGVHVLPEEYGHDGTYRIVGMPPNKARR